MREFKRRQKLKQYHLKEVERVKTLTIKEEGSNPQDELRVRETDIIKSLDCFQVKSDNNPGQYLVKGSQDNQEVQASKHRAKLLFENAIYHNQQRIHQVRQTLRRIYHEEKQDLVNVQKFIGEADTTLREQIVAENRFIESNYDVGQRFIDFMNEDRRLKEQEEKKASEKAAIVVNENPPEEKKEIENSPQQKVDELNQTPVLNLNQTQQQQNPPVEQQFMQFFQEMAQAIQKLNPEGQIATPVAEQVTIPPPTPGETYICTGCKKVVNRRKFIFKSQMCRICLYPTSKYAGRYPYQKSNGDNPQDQQMNQEEQKSELLQKGEQSSVDNSIVQKSTQISQQAIKPTLLMPSVPYQQQSGFYGTTLQVSLQQKIADTIKQCQVSQPMAIQQPRHDSIKSPTAVLSPSNRPYVQAAQQSPIYVPNQQYVNTTQFNAFIPRQSLPIRMPMQPAQMITPSYTSYTNQLQPPQIVPLRPLQPSSSNIQRPFIAPQQIIMNTTYPTQNPNQIALPIRQLLPTRMPPILRSNPFPLPVIGQTHLGGGVPQNTILQQYQSKLNVIRQRPPPQLMQYSGGYRPIHTGQLPMPQLILQSSLPQ